jgi:hypothetical protein
LEAESDGSGSEQSIPREKIPDETEVSTASEEIDEIESNEDSSYSSEDLDELELNFASNNEDVTNFTPEVKTQP